MEVRPCYFGGAWVDTPNYDRAKLAVGTKIAGPAIIRQYDTTTVLLPRHTAEVDGHGNHSDLARRERELSTMSVKVDPITLDIIENALKNARFEMDGVVVRDLALAGHPRAARRIPDDLQRARSDGRRPVRILHSGDRRAVRGRHQRRRHLRLERSLCLQGIDLAQQRLVRDDADLPRERAGRFQLDLRPHGRCRRQGAGLDAVQFPHDLGRGAAHSAGAHLRQGRAQQGRPRHHAQQHAHAGHEPRRPDGADRRLPHRGNARARAVRPLRPRHLHGCVRHAARPHPRSHEGAHPEIHSGRAGQLHGLCRRRRARQRPVQDDAVDLSPRRDRCLRLDRNRPAGRRARSTSTSTRGSASCSSAST